jgi:hypothetical protein
MMHNIPNIYEFLVPRSFRDAVHGEEVEVKNCVLGDENRTILSDAYVVWKSDCLVLNFNNSYMKICTDGKIIYVGEITERNMAAWENFVNNYEF